MLRHDMQGDQLVLRMAGRTRRYATRTLRAGRRVRAMGSMARYAVFSFVRPRGLFLVAIGARLFRFTT